jgi:hypothetical protein
MEPSFEVGNLVVIGYPAYKNEIGIIREIKYYPNKTKLYVIKMLVSGEVVFMSGFSLKELGNN